MPRSFGPLFLPSLAISLAWFGASCSDRIASPSDPLAQRVIEMGFRPDMIEDRGNYFLVEGDIVIWKRDLQGAPNPHQQPEFQWRTNNLFGDLQENRPPMKVSISGLNTGWAAATRDAMVEWTSILGVSISFIEGTPADITVSPSSSLDSGTIAQSAFPSGGKPGSTIQVSTSFDTLTASQKKFVMVHEFGHTIGFRHTNWRTFDCQSPPCSPGSDGAIRIGHTDSTDASSVMNGGTGGTPWNRFSSWDLEAARVLYPYFPTITTNETTTGNPVIVHWTRNTGAVGYVVWASWNGMDSDINGNPVVVRYWRDLGYTTDTTFVPGPVGSADANYTGDASCEYGVSVKVVFAPDTVVNYLWSHTAGGGPLPACDPNWPNQ